MKQFLLSSLSGARWWVAAISLTFAPAAFGQSLALQQVPNLSKCTGDTLTVAMTVGAPGFGIGNKFVVQIAQGLPPAVSFASPIVLPIVGWSPSTSGTVLDTIGAGAKLFKVVIPKSIVNNNFYSLRVRGTNPVGFSDTIVMAVNVSPTGKITAIANAFVNRHTSLPNDWGFCDGDTALLSATPGLASYQWLESGNPIAGKTQSTLNVFQSGVYSVKVSNGACFSTSKDTIVNQFSPVSDISHSNIPSLFVRDKNTTIDSLAFCETDTITLAGPIPSMPMTTIGYQWIRDSIGLFSQAFPRAIAGATQVGYKTARSGAYRLVTSWNPGGCPDTSGYVWLFVDTIPDVFIVNKPWPGQGAPSLSICPNDSTLLSAIIQSNPGVWSYQWQVRYPITGNWQNIPNDTLATLSASTKIVPGNAQYRLIVEGEACDYTTAAVQVTLVPFPTVATVPADSTFICFGDSTQLAVIGNALTYSWNLVGGSNTSFFTKTPGKYVVEATGPNGCLSHDTVLVKLFTVSANAGPDLLVLPGEVVQLNATGGVMYYWYADKPVYFSDPYNPNAQTQPTQDTTYYYVDVLSAEGCFDRDTLMVVQFDPTSLLVDLSNVQNFISPNGDGKNDFLDLSEVVRLDSCGITILNRWGATVYEDTRYVSGWTGTNNAGDPLPNGTYYIILNKGEEIRYRGAVTLVR